MFYTKILGKYTYKKLSKNSWKIIKVTVKSLKVRSLTTKIHRGEGSPIKVYGTYKFSKFVWTDATYEEEVSKKFGLRGHAVNGASRLDVLYATGYVVSIPTPDEKIFEG